MNQLKQSRLIKYRKLQFIKYLIIILRFNNNMATVAANAYQKLRQLCQYNNLLQSEVSTISIFLDYTMFLFAVVASLLIILGYFGDEQHYVIIILLAYLTYLIFFRLKRPESQSHRKYTVNRISDFTTNEKKQSTFLQQLEDIQKQSIQDKSNRSGYLKDIDMLNQSFRSNQKYLSENQFSQLSQNEKSYVKMMNRSKRSKAKKSSQDNCEGSNAHSISHLFSKKDLNQSKSSDDLNSSTVNKFEATLTLKNKREEKIEKYVKQKNKQFLNDALKLFSDRDILRKLDNFAKICATIADRYQKDNLANLSQIIHFIQSNYSVKVNYSCLPQLQLSRSNTSQRYSPGQSILLKDLLNEILRRKNKRLPFQLRPFQHQNNFMMNKKLSENQLPEREFHKLEKLMEKRIELDQYLFEPNRNSITVDETIEKLDYLQSFIENHNDQQKFISETPLNIDEDQITQEEVGFNVVRNKVNQLIKQEELRLSFDKQFFFGFLKTSKSRMKIKKSVIPAESIYHYDLYDISNQQTYNCIVGTKNRMCTLYFYLQVLYRNHLKMVRDSPELSNLIADALGKIII